MNARGRWVLAIVGLLGGNAAAMTALIVSANADGAQVIPGYYAKASKYNDEIEQAERNRVLGWRVDVAVEGAALRIAARDASGQALEGAVVRIAGYPRARAAQRFELEATRGELPAGRYLARLPDTGRLDLTISIERGGERFVEKAAVEVAP